MSESKIEWTDVTWNPIAGCTWASAGCDHCYAATMTRRLEAMGQADYAGLTTAKHFNGKIRLRPGKLAEPLKWRKPRRVFVNSMSDLFHKDVPYDFIDQVFATMVLCWQHIFQILTKRPERMADYCGRFQRDPLPNVWLGVSVENQTAADERIPHLLRTPAAVRFLSCEPLIAPVDLSTECTVCDYCGRYTLDKQSWECPCGKPLIQDAYSFAERVDWVIPGCESRGSRAGRFADGYEAAARSIVQQCQAAGVAVLYKQMPINGRVSHDPAEWPEDLRIREYPTPAACRGA